MIKLSVLMWQFRLLCGTEIKKLVIITVGNNGRNISPSFSLLIASPLFAVLSAVELLFTSQLQLKCHTSLTVGATVSESRRCWTSWNFTINHLCDAHTAKTALLERSQIFLNINKLSFCLARSLKTSRKVKPLKGRNGKENAQI